MPSAKPITGSQVTLIHTLLTRRGIEDALYREMLMTLFGVTTCKALTRHQAHQLLNRLGAGKLGEPGARAKPKKKERKPRPKPLPPGVAAIAPTTKKQRNLIDQIVRELEWHVEDGYVRWLEVNMGLVQVRTHAEASRVIEGLKAMKRRQKQAQRRAAG